MAISALFGAQAASAATIPVTCASGAAGLVAAVTNANSTPAADVIEIGAPGAPCATSLTAVADATAGGNGLPVITQPLTINGNGSTVARAPGAPNFRILFANNAPLTVNQLTLGGGSLAGANVGAGIAGLNSVVTLDRVTVTNNATAVATANANGGGIWVSGGSLNVDHSTIANNIANAGGGIYALSSPVTVRRSTLSLNGAVSVGAAWIVGTTATFENDTFSVNYANNGVAGITASNSGTTDGVVTVQSSTFADSSVTNSVVPANSLATVRTSGTGVGGTINVTNSIIADTDSTAAAAVAPCAVNPGGAINFTAPNIEYPTNTPACGASTTRANPLLAALALNGGTTQNYRPQAGSPAINGTALSCPATDQRDKPRPAFASCDIGSVEVQAPDTAVVGPSGNTTTTTTTFTGTGEGTLSFQCSVDSGMFVGCSSPFSPALPDGPHTIAVRAQDTYGNADPTPASVSFTLDTTNPVVTITNPPGPSITVDHVSLDFTVADLTATTTTCKLDAAAAAPCTSPYDPGTLTDGPHTITIKATDALGHVGSASTSFTVNLPAQTINVPCGDVTALRNAITAANATAAPDVIEVTGGPCTFTLTNSVDATAGGNGLPVVVHPLTINGHGSTIVRSTAGGTPAFRILFASNAVDAGSSLELHDLTLQGGAPTGPNVGGGLVSVGAAIVLDHVSFVGNVAGQGGGQYALGGSVAIDHSSYYFNVASVGGGLVTAGATATVQRTTFAANQASSVGGAYVLGGTAMFENDTFGANSATNGIAGLTVANSGATSGSATVRYSTFADNAKAGSTAPGGALTTFQQSGGGTAAISVANSVVADTDSTAAAAYAPCDTSLGGTITDGGGNIEYPGNSCGFPGSPLNPQLLAFSFATGAYAPGQTSPVIDHAVGAGPATDQNGHGRPDGDGNDSGAIETDPPETTLNGPANDPTNTPTVTMTSDQATQAFICKVDSGPFAVCTSPYTVPASVPDGTHTVTVAAFNATSPFYIDPSPSSVTFTIDRTAPVVHITNKPPALPQVTGDNNPSLNFTVDDSAATVTCVVDNAAPVSCSSPFAPGTLTDGPHTITVTATDAVGNVGSDSTTFTVDTTAPTTVNVACGDVTALRAAITAANATLAPDVIEVTGGPCTFTLTNSVDAAGGGNGLPIVRHPLTINGHGSTIARSTAGGTPSFRILFASNDIDPANRLTLDGLTIASGNLPGANVGAGLASLGSAIRIDNSTFIGNVTTGSGAAMYVQGGSLDVDHTTLQQNAAGNIAGGMYLLATAATVQRSTFVLNGANNTGAAIVLGGTATFENDTFAVNYANNGVGGIAVGNSAAVNGVANVSSSTFADQSVTSSAAPASALLTFQGGGSGTATINVSNSIVTDTDSAAAPAGLKPCDTSLGGTITNGGHNIEFPGSTCGFGTTADPKLAAYALNGGSTGNYRLLPSSPAIDAGGATCPATDQRGFARPDGNACDVGSYEVDSPNTSAVAPASPTSTPTITFTSDQAGSTFQCRSDGGAYAACTSPYTPAFAQDGSADGPHTVDIRAVNPAGYVDPSPASVTFTYFSVPETTITQGPSGTTLYSAPAVFKFVSSKTPSTFECQLDAAPFAACTSPKTYQPSELAPAGSLAVTPHTFRVRAIDAGGHVDPTPAQVSFNYKKCLIIRIDILGNTICAL